MPLGFEPTDDNDCETTQITGFQQISLNVDDKKTQDLSEVYYPKFQNEAKTFRKIPFESNGQLTSDDAVIKNIDETTFGVPPGFNTISKDQTDQSFCEIYEPLNNLTVALSEELTSAKTLTNIPPRFETSSVSANLLVPELKAFPNFQIPNNNTNVPLGFQNISPLNSACLTSTGLDKISELKNATSTESNTSAEYTIPDAFSGVNFTTSLQ